MSGFNDPRTRRWILGGVCVLAAVILTSRGLGNESYVSTHGDPPRYMMNAVFILDVLRDRPFDSLNALRDYATLYYARYPALSLGHHPPLASVLQVPFIAVFGPSITTARLPMILIFAVGVYFLYRLVSDLYDEWAGVAAGLVLAASPSLVYETQSALSDPTAMAFSVVAAYLLHRFCASQQKWYLVAFTAATVLSVYGKPNALAGYPAFLAYACARLGWRRLFRRDTIVAALTIGVFAGAFLVVNAGISSFNTERSSAMLRAAASTALSATSGGTDEAAVAAADWPFRAVVINVASFVPYTLRVQLSAVMASVSVAGLLLLLFKGRPEAWLFGTWTATTFFLVLTLTGQTEMERYGAYWLPALATSIGYLTVVARRSPVLTVTLGGALAVALALEARAAAEVRVHGLSGYEEAARYVQTHTRGTTVLFSADFDSGYFVFFARKHDPERRSIILRADKIFTVSMMQQVSVAELIDRPELIAPTLGRLGVGYVVIEDRHSSSHVLEWLRDELKTPRYIERLRTRIDTRDERIQQTDVVVYEVRDVSSPDPNARLDLRLPLVSRRFDVPLADLTAPTHR